MDKQDWSGFIEAVKGDPELRSELREALGPQQGVRYPDVLKFRHETGEALKKNTRLGYKHIEAFNVILRERFGLKNVQKLTPEMLPEARQLLAGYKDLIRGDDHAA